MIKLIFILLLLVPFHLIAQNNTENFFFGVQFKPIISAAYFDAGSESKQWENYNLKIEPRFGQSLGMIILLIFLFKKDKLQTLNTKKNWSFFPFN